jgi:amino acid transporter
LYYGKINVNIKCKLKNNFIQGALCYAELGCAYVSSGGDYTYLRVAFGNFLGFLRVWIEVVLSRPMIVVLSVLTASNYLVYWFYPTCPPPDILVKCLSSFLLLIVGFINLTSAIWTNRLHQICNYCKIGMKNKQTVI